MKHVEWVRERVLVGQQKALMTLCGHISTRDGNQDAVQKLKGDEGMQILADVTDFLMERLGHKVKTSSKSPFSKTRRRAKKVASG